jgi:ATP-dependent helicase/nuclease subunit B
MNKLPQNDAQWAQWLADGQTCIVLVDHEGEAAAYRQRIAEQQGDAAYLEMVRVVPKAQWLVELWDSSFPSRQVLRPVQLLVLAEQCVENSNLLADSVIGVQGIAQRFVDAFELVERYGLDVPVEFADTTEQQAFHCWQGQLRATLREQDLLSAGQLAAALLHSLEVGALELPARLALSHALEFTALEQRLLSALKTAGVEHQELPPFQADSSISTHIGQYCAPDFATEVQAAARWAAAQLDAAQTRQKNGVLPRLALIAPDIRPYEEALRRALEREVYPYSLFPAAAPDAQLAEPWRIGAGRLASYPVVAAALDILMVPGKEIDLELFSRVLRSPFVIDASALRARRALLDLRLRENLQSTSTIRRALREAQYAGYDDAAHFLGELQQLATQYSLTALPSQWVQYFDQELLLAGWPNREAGDPVLDQCRQGFSQVMDTLRALDRQLGKVSRATALRWLQHVLQSKRFELKRDQAPPLQILNMEEASGQFFDGVWILGLDDSALPVAVEPSPFLSREQLRTAGVPRADHADALRRDRALLQFVLQSAPECVVSMPRQSGEGVAQTACALLAWDYSDWSAPAQAPGFTESATIALPEDDSVRSVSPHEKLQLRGGTGLFKAYALSPFFAFLKYRLGLQPMPTPVEGLEPRRQGAWVHGALENFWNETKNSEVLASLSEADLHARVDAAVEIAMRDGAMHGDELIRIEKRRIRSLVLEWLAFEKSRDEDFIVEATEQRGRVDAFGIPLRVQIDRLDRIGDHRVVMDYKTGTVAANSLNAENLLEPQLPLYALLAGSFAGDVDGIVLAQIHARDGMKVHMRSSWCANLVDKKVRNAVDTPEKWQAESEAWTKVLQHYANGFLSGDVAHDYQQAASAFAYDPYVSVLARAQEVLADE